MKQKESNYHEMIRRVLGHFELHPDAWRDEDVIVGRVSILNTIDENLTKQSGTQRRVSSGTFTVKDAELDRAGRMATLLATRIRSFARTAKDPLLLAAADHSDSDFRYGAQDHRTGLINDILDLAGTHADALVRFKITAADIDALRESLKRAGALRKKAGDDQNHSTVATARIPALIEDARAELEALDDDIPGLLANEPFVEAYFVARRITDRRATQSVEAPTP
ncbi:MAG: hypothetical protein EOO12_00400 [Chitinophagaceae bacterium]|nr:MAG: hypothetical protein EOO12_00400 [Chitinophagaceae bacterium]